LKRDGNTKINAKVTRKNHKFVVFYFEKQKESAKNVLSIFLLLKKFKMAVVYCEVSSGFLGCVF